MPFVVTENCINCKYTDCVEVCPVDCFHEGPNFLVIDPDECIDCTLCEPECPANAIYPEEDVPTEQKQCIALNAELAKAWPVVTVRREPMPDAAEWNGKPDKLAFATTLKMLPIKNKTLFTRYLIPLSCSCNSFLNGMSGGGRAIAG